MTKASRPRVGNRNKSYPVSVAATSALGIDPRIPWTSDMSRKARNQLFTFRPIGGVVGRAKNIERHRRARMRQKFDGVIEVLLSD